VRCHAQTERGLDRIGCGQLDGTHPVPPSPLPVEEVPLVGAAGWRVEQRDPRTSAGPSTASASSSKDALRPACCGWTVGRASVLIDNPMLECG